MENRKLLEKLVKFTVRAQRPARTRAPRSSPGSPPRVSPALPPLAQKSSVDNKLDPFAKRQMKYSAHLKKVGRKLEQEKICRENEVSPDSRDTAGKEAARRMPASKPG